MTCTVKSWSPVNDVVGTMMESMFPVAASPKTTVLGADKITGFCACAANDSVAAMAVANAVSVEVVFIFFSEVV